MRYLCIHGHFYQPPRENAWLEEVELQDSAYPYHDWNERITAECYAANTVARILDGEGRIAHIVNNYAKISFNFGPTLLSWMQEKAPEVYRSILQADKDSQQQFSGHGSALAQAYNHMIMPLANRRDKVTQVLWGIRDFEQRFGRKPEGMWLPETAVDLESLEVLAEHGIRFTVLAPTQANRIRKIHTATPEGGEPEIWQEVTGGHIDPTRAYVQRLPSGKSIALFFYDGPISRAVAFEKLLVRGEGFVSRLMHGFSDGRPEPQLVHIATDGESYGHHHAHGDMGLAYALQQVEAHPDVQLTNYGEFLEKHPPQWEVEIIENTSWSCIHGIERWRSDCGCNSGRPVWRQGWRAPLREAFDWLRDTLAPLFEERGRLLVRDPWMARNEYLGVILDRAPESIRRFINDRAIRELNEEDQARLLKLMEIQRQLLLMYTSCAWFFDEVSGIETVQVIQYAARAIQLARDLFGEDLEEQFLARLEKARSNLPAHGDGRRIYEKFVKPAAIDWSRIGAHYAISSLFESYAPQARLDCFLVDREHYEALEAGKAKLVVGRARITSMITREAETVIFGALHFGDHNVNGGVTRFADPEVYLRVVSELTQAFAKADFPEVMRLMDRGFGQSSYSLRSLFRDEQRRVMKRVLKATHSEAEEVYRRLYEQNLPTMRYLAEMGVPLPPALQKTAEFLINTDLRWAIGDDDPYPDQIRALLTEARRWDIELDLPGLAYKFKKTLGRVAERWQKAPGDLAILQTLDEAVELARGFPREVDLWQAQNEYYKVLQTSYPLFLTNARAGEEAAHAWLTRFVGLGQKLGVQVNHLHSEVAEAQRKPLLKELFEGVVARRRTPLSTYRLQFNRQFPFAEAKAQAAYLHELGITDIYSSPILKARPGSAHGYDICDHSQINPDLGGEEGFNAFAGELRERGLGLILDIVPNHMGIGHVSNLWWMDVLENGPSSIYASYFDIDWRPVNPDLENKVLLPILEDQYGFVLEAGKLRLAFEEGAFFLYYYEIKLPVAPRTYSYLLEHALPSLVQQLGEDNDHVQELRSILTALSYLPGKTELQREKIIERNREKEIIKRRVAALAAASKEVTAAIAATIKTFNGSVGDPRSYDRLDRLLEEQAFRPAYWRVATEEINYRRFFDINELAAIRVEKNDVFVATHRLLFRLLAEGKAHGLRIDHPDGLWDPAAYFRRLQTSYLLHCVRAALDGRPEPANLEQEVVERLAEHQAHEQTPRPVWPLYVAVEKILGDGEPLPQDWAVAGTSGYEYLNALGGLFVDRHQREAFDAIYSKFIGRRQEYNQLLVSSQKMIMLVSMASEVNALGHQLDRISERNRRYRDFTLNSLTFAVREVIAALVIYRTYITGPEHLALRDRMFIEEAVELAKNTNPRTAESLFDFVRNTLLLRNLDDFREEDRPRLVEWVMKFQQVSGPVLAKGLEDTVFYVFNRLVALNEVGGNPEHFGMGVLEFHRQNAQRLSEWPHSMLATSTHDTKRSEDVRARICVLSEMPGEWQDALNRWHALNFSKKTIVEDQPAPDPNDEWLLYQTLLGVWPNAPATPELVSGVRQRVLSYMHKATKEAKVHTSWVNPNEEYDAAVRDFVSGLLSDKVDDPFLQDLLAFQRRVAYFGFFNSLAQVLLKFASPGVPDTYQGTELWDFSLVDPDNRRPVDFARRRELLSQLKTRIAAADDLLPLVFDLLASMEDGRIKLYVIYRLLHCRQAKRALFLEGSYIPLEAIGPQKEHVTAFARSLADDVIIAVVPRLVVGLCEGEERLPIGAEVWQDTWLVAPADQVGRRFRNLLTGEVWRARVRDDHCGLLMAEILGHFPVALLERLPEE